MREIQTPFKDAAYDEVKKDPTGDCIYAGSDTPGLKLVIGERIEGAPSTALDYIASLGK